MTEDVLLQCIEKAVEFEGCIAWLYRDYSDKGIVTCASGLALFSQADALRLPWHETDGSLSGPAQVARDYQAVLAAPLGHTAGYYENLTACRLRPDDMRDLCRADLLREWGKLIKHFPLADSYPEAAQAALIDLALNLGGDFPPKWPKFTAAVLAGDWSEAAAQSHRAPPISGARNDYVRDRFLACL